MRVQQRLPAGPPGGVHRYVICHPGQEASGILSPECTGFSVVAGTTYLELSGWKQDKYILSFGFLDEKPHADLNNLKSPCWLNCVSLENSGRVHSLPFLGARSYLLLIGPHGPFIFAASSVASPKFLSPGSFLLVHLKACGVKSAHLYNNPRDPSHFRVSR